MFRHDLFTASQTHLSDWEMKQHLVDKLRSANAFCFELDEIQSQILCWNTEFTQERGALLDHGKNIIHRIASWEFLYANDPSKEASSADSRDRYNSIISDWNKFKFAYGKFFNDCASSIEVAEQAILQQKDSLYKPDLNRYKFFCEKINTDAIDRGKNYVAILKTSAQQETLAALLQQESQLRNSTRNLLDRINRTLQNIPETSTSELTQTSLSYYAELETLRTKDKNNKNDLISITKYTRRN